MNVFTDGRTIELEMNNKIMESCENNVNKTFIIDLNHKEEIMNYLVGKFIFEVEPIEDEFLELTIRWERKEAEENIKELENKFGFTNYKGKEYALIENAEYWGSDKRIGNSIYIVDGELYSANCIDEEGKEFTAYFKTNDTEEVENICDWENASYIELKTE